MDEWQTKFVFLQPAKKFNDHLLFHSSFFLLRFRFLIKEWTTDGTLPLLSNSLLTVVINSFLHQPVVCLEFFVAVNQTQSIGCQRHTVRPVQVPVLLLEVVFSTIYGRHRILEASKQVIELFKFALCSQTSLIRNSSFHGQQRISSRQKPNTFLKILLLSGKRKWWREGREHFQISSTCSLRIMQTT